MTRVPKSTDASIGEFEIVEDFLPPPDQLVLKENGVKVTFTLSRQSVEFFKAHAATTNVPYQRIIQSVLESYAGKYAKRAPTQVSSGQREA